MIKHKDELVSALPKFKHKISGYVKFHEIDHFDVVYNLKYLEGAEVARVEYCRKLDISILSEDFSVYLVHLDINYFHPATFFDEYNIYTRISNIGRSSITFEHIIFKKDETLLCACEAVQVYVDKENIPLPVPEYMRKKIAEFEDFI